MHLRILSLCASTGVNTWGHGLPRWSTLYYRARLEDMEVDNLTRLCSYTNNRW
jgi:hypothetical protein